MNLDLLIRTLHLVRADGPAGPARGATERGAPQGGAPAQLRDARYRRVLPGGRSAPLGPVRWETDRLREALRALDATRSPDAQALERLRSWLAATLEEAGWAEDRAAFEAAREAGRAGRLVISTEAEELTELPWEQLVLGGTLPLYQRQDLCILWRWPGEPELPRRTVPGPDGPCVDPSLAEGQVLLAWAEGDAGPVNAEGHRAALEEACAAAGRAWSACRVDRAGLRAALGGAGAPVVALALLAQGGAEQGVPGLYLEDGFISAEALVALLRPFAGALRLVVLLACASAKAGADRAHGLAQRLHAEGFEAVIGARTPLPVATAPALTRALFEQLLVAHRELGEALSVARGALQVHAPWSAAGLQLWCQRDRCYPIPLRPYRGLQSFEEAHRALFFGRDKEIGQLLSKLETLPDAGRFLLVLGASGTGKSSLVLAGALPRLRDKNVSIHVSRVTGALAGAPAEDGIWVVDQLEELFTDRGLGAMERGGGQALAEAALRALRGELLGHMWSYAQRSGCAVVATMRISHLGRFQELSHAPGQSFDKVALDPAHQLFVTRMEAPQLAQAIAGPAARAGLEVEPGLTELLVKDVDGEPGALPALQFALDALWRARRPGEGLSVRAYRSMGGVAGLISRRADAVIEALTPAQRGLARRVLVGLVALGDEAAHDLRRPRRVSELGLEGAPEWASVFGALIAGRLVVSHRDAHGALTLELAHEELLRSWGTLKAWVAEDRKAEVELRAVSARAQESLEAGEHLVGGWLHRARALRDQLPGALAQLVDCSAARVQAAQERERARREALEAAKARAEAEAARAAAEARRARDIARVALAQTVSDQPPVVVTLLKAVERPEETPGWWLLAFDVLTHAIPDMCVDTIGGGLYGFHLSPDGAQAITRSRRAELVCVALPSGEARWRAALGEAFVRQLDVAPAWTACALVLSDERALILDGEGAPLHEWAGGEDIARVWAVDAARALVLHREGALWVRDWSDGVRSRLLIDGFGAVWPTASRTAALALSEDGLLTLCPVQGQPQRLRIEGPARAVRWAEHVEELGLILVASGAPEDEAWTLYWLDAPGRSVALKPGILRGLRREGVLVVVRADEVEEVSLADGRGRRVHRASEPWERAWISEDLGVVVANRRSQLGAELVYLGDRPRSLALEGLPGRVLGAKIDRVEGDAVLEMESGALYTFPCRSPGFVRRISTLGEPVLPHRWAVRGGPRLTAATRSGRLVSAALTPAVRARALPETQQLLGWSADGEVLAFGEGARVWCAGLDGEPVPLEALHRRTADLGVMSPDGLALVLQGNDGWGVWETLGGRRLCAWTASPPARRGPPILEISSGRRPRVVTEDAEGVWLRTTSGEPSPVEGGPWQDAGFFWSTNQLWLLSLEGALWAEPAPGAAPRHVLDGVRSVTVGWSGELILRCASGGPLRLGPDLAARPIEVGADPVMLCAGGASGVVAYTTSTGGLVVVGPSGRVVLRPQGEHAVVLAFVTETLLVTLDNLGGLGGSGDVTLWDVRGPGRSVLLERQAATARAVPGVGVLVSLERGGRWPAPQVLWPLPLSVEHLRRALDAAPSWPLPPQLQAIAPETSETPA